MSEFLTGPPSPPEQPFEWGDRGPSFELPAPPAVPGADLFGTGFVDAATTVEPPKPKLFKRSLVMGLGALGLVAATMVGASALGRDTKTVHGTYTLFDVDGVDGTASDCYGDGGYDDVEEGLQVVVRNGDDKLLATTHLENSAGRTVSEVLGSSSSYSSYGRTLVECKFTFEAKVPADEKFYAFTTGGSDRRGKLLYSKDEMEQKDWTVHISLGS